MAPGVQPSATRSNKAGLRHAGRLLISPFHLGAPATARASSAVPLRGRGPSPLPCAAPSTARHASGSVRYERWAHREATPGLPRRGARRGTLPCIGRVRIWACVATLHPALCALRCSCSTPFATSRAGKLGGEPTLHRGRSTPPKVPRVRATWGFQSRRVPLGSPRSWSSRSSDPPVRTLSCRWWLSRQFDRRECGPHCGLRGVLGPLA
jgi:hypothetical protein